MKSLIGRFPFLPLSRPRRDVPATTVAPEARARELPTPALRHLGQNGELAIRSFDWNADADHLCAWQRETYAINFPDFKLSLEFAQAFRHDLRRAYLDSNHAIWMLDNPQKAPCGFIWVVLCTNSWTNERYGYVNNLFVEGNYRGQHLGEELLLHAQGWFKTRKVAKLRLTVTGSNLSARRLYERAGFEVERLEMEREI